jgi:2-dehydro-3-deoxyphosphogluconate aldolase/(4S)-4-hydroxy-2-oxoglutarate aldolase
VSRDTAQWIAATGLVPVLRAQSTEEALALARAMYAGGVDIIEVTTTIPNAREVLEKLKDEFGESILLGAGTVTTTEHCCDLIDAGAEFVVSPSLHPDVIAQTKERGKLMISGALTPTEIITAWRAGADVVKVFPCSAMGGASYLRAIKAPFPEIKLVPTGGVTLATARDFLDAGAMALGVGGDLVNTQMIRDGKPERVTETASAYLAVIAEWRNLRGSSI